MCAVSPPAEVWPAGDTKWQQRACGAGRREFGFGVVGNKDVVVGESCGDIVDDETAQKQEAAARSAAAAAAENGRCWIGGGAGESSSGTRSAG